MEEEREWRQEEYDRGFSSQQEEENHEGSVDHTVIYFDSMTNQEMRLNYI